MADTLLTDEALAMVGAEWPPSSDTVEAGAVRRWAHAVQLDDRQWKTGDAVPTTLCMSLGKAFMGRAAAASRFSPDEPPAYWLPPLRSTRSFNGGDRFTIHSPLRVGDRVMRTSKLVDVTERRTRDGRLRVFATSRTTYLVDGEPRVTWDNYTITLPEHEAPGSPRPRSVDQSPAAGLVARTPGDAVRGASVPVLELAVGALEICRFAGVNEEFALQHIDKDFARDSMGLPTTTVMGWLKTGLVTTALDRWAGYGRVTDLRARYSGIDLCDDVLRVEGIVAHVSTDVVEVELSVSNQRGEPNTAASARIARTPDAPATTSDA